MEDALNQLEEIARQMDTIGDDMSREDAVYKAELADRLRLGLTGDDAIHHYNEWMKREGMGHLKVI